MGRPVDPVVAGSIPVALALKCTVVSPDLSVICVVRSPVVAGSISAPSRRDVATMPPIRIVLGGWEVSRGKSDDQPSSEGREEKHHPSTFSPFGK
ncbi:MAG: hypothetical protein WC107_06210 [Patescibacteria group bacterium]